MTKQLALALKQAKPEGWRVSPEPKAREAAQSFRVKPPFEVAQRLIVAIGTSPAVGSDGLICMTAHSSFTPSFLPGDGGSSIALYPATHPAPPSLAVPNTAPAKRFCIWHREY